MKLEPAILENTFVRLEPMAEPHREGLRAACNADQRIWTDLYPISWANEHFDPTWEKLMADQAAGTTQAYAVIAAGDVVGITTFLKPFTSGTCPMTATAAATSVSFFDSSIS